MLTKDVYDIFKDKKVQLFVAHHDDESLYFGGLLTEIRRFSKIKITVLTDPAPNRPDTNTRLNSFKNVCWILDCTYSAYDCKDYAPINENPKEVVYRDFDKICDIVKNDVFGFKPDIVLTHNPDGEANLVYKGGHPMHKMITDAVLTVLRLDRPIFACSVSGKHDFEVTYDVGHKKILLDCYAPRWTPKDYPFAYNTERYVKLCL